MKFVEGKRVAVLAMAAVMTMNITGCKKVNDITSEGVVGTVVDAVSQKDITQVEVHGMKVDPREYAQKVTYDKVQDEGWMDEVYEPLVEEWDKKGIRLTSNTYVSMIVQDWYKNKEYSDETEKNQEKYREITVDLYPQKEENDLYGMCLTIESFKINDDRNNYDFQIGGISEKDVAKDYEKKSDFYPTLGPILHGDIFRSELNEIANGEYGKSYIAIYLDGKCVDISDYKEETQSIIKKAVENNDGTLLRKNEMFYELPGVLGIKLNTCAESFSVENALKNPIIEESTREKFLEYETAGVALVRSVQKLKEDYAKELVVVVAEERIGHMVKAESSQKEIDHEKENMRVTYIYITK